MKFTEQKFIFSFLFLFVIVSCRDFSNENPSDSSQKEKLSFISKDSTKAAGLISVQEAHNILQNGIGFSLFEVSKKEKYENGHLPGAVHLWRPDYASGGNYDYGGMRASPEEMEKLLSEKGVGQDDQILIYDVKGSCDALRLAFILKMYGHQKVEVINGGKAAWKASGFELTKEVPKTKSKTAFKFSSTKDDSNLALIDEVKAAVHNPQTILLDTREPEEYQGAPYISKGKLHSFKNGAFARGCIPSAVHLNWSDAVDLHSDHRFKSLKDLKYNFEKAGVTPDKNIIVYCQSGVRSAHTAYVLTELLEYPNVKNYDGSWIEWTYFYKKDSSVRVERHISDEEYNKQYAMLKNQLSNSKK